MGNQNSINQKQKEFCVAYTTVGADTFGNATQSALKAGYPKSSAHTQGWKLLQKDYINTYIGECYENYLREHRVSHESVLANLAHDREMARKHHQYSVAKGCTELEGKFLTMFGDRIAVNTEKTREILDRMTDEEKETAKIIADIRTEKLAKTTIIPFKGTG